jgi:NADPH:quinone reductase-like Zn-dependent oxidoreductase
MAKAVRFDQYGGIDVLYVADVAVPDPPPGELVVEVRAAGLNPGEAAIRQGFLESRFPATFPSGEGTDLAGTVTRVGEGVQAFAIGDEVVGWTDRRASHAEYVTVPEDHLIHKPTGLSWEVAGSLFVAGTTAFAAVRAVDAHAGDTVVVSAAAGGVGSIVVQLATVRGAEVVGIASAANHEWLRSVGVTPVAYGNGLADRIRAAAPNGVDAFIDTFGEEYLRLAVELGVEPDRIETIIAFDAAGEVGAKAEGSATAADTGVLADMADLVASGRITVPIAATYPLDQVQAAYAELEKRHTRGKIVLLP